MFYCLSNSNKKKSSVRAEKSPLVTQPEGSATEVKVLACSSAVSSTFPGTANASQTIHRNTVRDLGAGFGAQASVSFSTEHSVFRAQ